LSGELKSPPDSLSHWKIAEQAPFKYRVLHRAIVVGSYQLINDGNEDNKLFFNVYRFVSLLFQLIAVLSVYFFCWKLELTGSALAAGILFCLLPPMLLAYNVPVHTREDMLGYTILIWGLLAIEFNQTVGIMVATIFGVACRETLLILPLVNLLHNTKQPVLTRLIITVVAGSEFLGLRWIQTTENQAYNPWEGLQWNLANLSQVLFFGFVSFGAAWVPTLIRLFSMSRTNDNKNDQIKSNIVDQSWLTALLLIVVTTFIGGIFNEIRLLYLYSPWAVVIMIKWYATGKVNLLAYWRSRLFLFTFITCLVTLTFAFLYVLAIGKEIADQSAYKIPYLAWLIVGFFHLFLATIHLPFFWHTIYLGNKEH